MALSAKLTMRQGQAMVLTPQLLQAIKLLQMPNIELAAFLEGELAANPLLERDEEREAAPPEPGEHPIESAPHEGVPEVGDWARDSLETDAQALEANLGTEIGNAFDPDRPARDLEPAPAPPEGLSINVWSGAGGLEPGKEPDLEAYVAETASLREHLERQAALLFTSPADRIIV